MITEQKRTIDGLQMRVQAQKRSSGDFGLEKMKKEAADLMKRADKLGYK